VNYYEHHIGDYAEATTHLSIIEDGAYCRLIRKYYAIEKPLPSETKAVERLIGARTKEERGAVRAVLEEFFKLESDGWHNKRCDQELTRFHDKRTKAKRSADARWQGHQAHTERNANASRTHDSRNALQTPDSRLQSPDTSVGSDARARDDLHAKSTNGSDACREPEFEPIKAAYPPFGGGQDWLKAEHLWRHLLDDGRATEAELLAGVTRYAAYVAAGGVSDPKFVMTPGKFFGSAERYYTQAWQAPAPKTASLTIDELKAKYPCPELDRVGS
jgi:uncharacterized protein YdaU (DUF1376 family)